MLSILKKKPGSQCAACGVCCELYGHTIFADEEDVERWREERRDDLLCHVGPDLSLWHDPASGERLPRCPKLTRTALNTGHCSINSTKPMMCRRYPTPAHRERCVMGVNFTP